MLFERREAELARQLATIRTEADTTQQLLNQQLTDTRRESAGQEREIKLLHKDLARIQGLHDQLVEEKITWRHERVQMEEMLRKIDQE